MRDRLSSFFSLFASTGTLFCCALPALLVSIGAGATLASLVTEFPALVWFSAHKIYAFIFAGIMLSVAGVFQYRARNLPCPIDPKLAQACDRARTVSLSIYFVSVAIFSVGVTFAYILPLFG